ncbi:hypothetical protein PBI_BALOO_57 [Mycobacterium phage Baloo]|uniref:DUF6378 domain-containing protein n=1 Tax=Mycobacterium phage Baloo TaxID=2099645 RepID=A0A2P1CCU4_9CAUD|nr:hypothetical protein PBI_BALOO_57 [Mycobacterium phage Baloo]
MTCHDCGREFADDELNAADSEGRRVHLPSCDNPMKFNPREVSMPVLPPGTPKECTCSPSLNAPYDETCPIHRWYTDAAKTKREATTGDRARNICEHAADLVNGDRNADYGDAFDNFTETGKLWAVVFGHDVSPEQVALCLDLVKTARLIHNPQHADSWVDKVGYSALGGGIAGRPKYAAGGPVTNMLHTSEPQSAADVGLGPITPDPSGSYHYVVREHDGADPATLVDNPERVGIVCICEPGSPMIKAGCPADRHIP